MSGIYEKSEPRYFVIEMRRALTANQLHYGTDAGWASLSATYDALRTAHELGRAPDLSPQTPRSTDCRRIDDLFPRNPFPSLAEEGSRYHAYGL